MLSLGTAGAISSSCRGRSVLRAHEPATVSQRSWHSLGPFLAREILLISAEKRKAARKEWEEICEAERTLDDRLTIGLVGGTGVGKSTLINALAGKEISTSGDRRPTTDRVVAYHHRSTALPEALPRSDILLPVIVHQEEALERVIVLDFPDFDSVEELHHEILERFLPHLDVLIVLVDDVKYGDLRLFELLLRLRQSHENLHVVLNKIDRLERRYPGRSRRVASEILDDLVSKLEAHAGIQVSRERLLAISARNALASRALPSGRGAQGLSEEARDLGDFNALVALLEGYRLEKRRRAAKELNIEARKEDLSRRLRDLALGVRDEERVRDALDFAARRKAELEKTLAGISPAILRLEERRRLASLVLRREAIGFGFPLDFVLALMGELRSRRMPSGAVPADSKSEELGGTVSAGRVKDHYRAYLDAASNAVRELELRLPDLISRESIQLPEEEWALSVVLPSVRPSRRWNHFLPFLVLVLFLWSFAYPAVNGALRRIAGEEGASWSKVLKDLLFSLMESLNPVLLVGFIVLVLLSYLATAVVVWIRHVERIDHAISRTEDEVRERIHAHGHRALAEASKRLSRWEAERAELESILEYRKTLSV